MKILIVISIFLLTAIINYLSVIAVSKDGKREENNKLPSARLKEVIVSAKKSFPKGKKWFLKKEIILSAFFALISGAGSFLVVFFLADWMAALRYCLIIVILSSVAIVDCFTKKVFNKVTLTALLIRLILFIPEYFCYGKGFKDIFVLSVVGLVVGFVLLAILSAISKGGLGMGDVKIIAVLGFYTGVATLFYTLVLGLVCCFFYCIYLILIEKKNKKYELPFGPFILIGLVLALVII